MSDAIRLAGLEPADDRLDADVTMYNHQQFPSSLSWFCVHDN